MIAITIGKSAPAPRPWMARNTTSSVMFCEAPDSQEPIRKRATPIISITLRPKTSENLP